MNHNLYEITAEELLDSPRIPLLLAGSAGEVYYEYAVQMIDEIRQNNAQGKKTVMILPCGPIDQYPIFARLVNRYQISLKNVWFINMDEYLDDNKEWVSIDHPLSFRGFMKRTVYDKINPELVMPEVQRIFPDPKNPGHIPEVIGQLGGVDICFGGIGINGHVAFNEADASLSNEELLAQQTRVLKITPETRTANAIGDFNGALEDMPHYCITIGINDISHARKIRLGCFRNWHRAVVRRAVYGEQTSEFPVSLLQNHSDINLKITEFVASLTD